jgi:hypothetical protein
VSVFVFSNNAQSTLAAPIAPTATSIALATGTGALFPNPSVGPPQQQFALTLNDAATGLLYEICYCTARTGDVLTVVRAQEGTTALNWLAGDIAANMATAGQMAAMQQTGATNPARTITTSGAFAISTSDAGGGILLNRVTSPGVSSATLPSTPGSAPYTIQDGASNFNAFPVTISFPGGTTGPNGRTTWTLNVNSGSYTFLFYADSNIWGVRGP